MLLFMKGCEKMALYRTELEWHDLKIDPDDLPDEEDPILVTVEMPHDGTRSVWIDAFLKNYNDSDRYLFCVHHYEPLTGKMEYVPVWYKVVAWAYPPEPFPM